MSCRSSHRSSLWNEEKIFNRLGRFCSKLLLVFAKNWMLDRIILNIICIQCTFNFWPPCLANMSSSFFATFICNNILNVSVKVRYLMSMHSTHYFPNYCGEKCPKWTLSVLCCFPPLPVRGLLLGSYIHLTHWEFKL